MDISMKQLLISTLLAVTASAWAQAPAPVEVKDAWVRATVAQQKSTGAFMQLTAPADTRVVGARSPIAGVAQIHEMAMEKDVMRMREVKELALPAGKAVELKPGGYHVMLLDLKGQVKAGDVVPVTLVLESKDGQRSTLEVKATARPLGGAAAAAPAAAGGDHGAHKH
jgi:periplasmic copper chaperone A